MTNMDKKEQKQLKEASDDIKRLEKLIAVLDRRTQILAKENAKLKSTVISLHSKVGVLESTISRIIKHS